MRVVALISGGKDSCFNMMQCEKFGHKIVALANLKPISTKDEMDSFMYQTVGHEAIEAYAEAMELPLFRATITGEPLQQSLSYSPSQGNDEVESLYNLLKYVKDQMPDVEAVSSGAILSNYQRNRVESVCQRLGLVSLAYLWRRDQTELLNEMIQSNISAVLIKVAALGLRKEHLGKSLSELHQTLMKLKERYELNVCGEGGEYESFTLDCPLFKKRIVIDESKVIMHSNDPISPVAYLKLLKYHLEQKENSEKSFQPPKVFYLDATTAPKQLLSSSSTASHTPVEFVKSNVEVDEKKDRRRNRREFFVVSATKNEQRKLSLAEQIADIFHQTEKLLSMESMNFSNIISAQIYIRKISDFVTLNEMYKKYFQLNPPSRATIEVSLTDPDKDVIVEFWAMSSPKQSMHVQSISCWAAACIGPYSQLTQVDEILFLSGQIGLNAPTMQLVPVASQHSKALEHLQSVLLANDSNSELICSLICFHTKFEDFEKIHSEVEKWLKRVPQKNEVLVAHLEVPALPKGAAFESMAIALTNKATHSKSDRQKEEAEETLSDHDEQEEKNSVAKKVLSAEVRNFDTYQLRSLSLRVVNKVSITHLLIEIPIEETSFDVLSANLSTILSEKMKQILSKSESLFAVRIYHHTKYFSALIHLDQLKKIFTSSSSVSFVPVRGIGSQHDQLFRPILLIELYLFYNE